MSYILSRLGGLYLARRGIIGNFGMTGGLRQCAANGGIVVGGADDDDRGGCGAGALLQAVPTIGMTGIII